jgi:hypothetical protein
MMEAASTFEKSVIYYLTTRRDVQKTVCIIGHLLPQGRKKINSLHWGIIVACNELTMRSVELWLSAL